MHGVREISLCTGSGCESEQGKVPGLLLGKPPLRWRELQPRLTTNFSSFESTQAGTAESSEVKQNNKEKIFKIPIYQWVSILRF